MSLDHIHSAITERLRDRAKAAEARVKELEDSRQRIYRILRRADHAETFTADDLVTAWQDIRTELVSMGPPTGSAMNPVAPLLGDYAYEQGSARLTRTGR